MHLSNICYPSPLVTLIIETKRNNHFIRDGTIAALAILYDKHIIKTNLIPHPTSQRHPQARKYRHRRDTCLLS